VRRACGANLREQPLARQDDAQLEVVLAVRLVRAHALAQGFGRLVQLAADEHLPDHQVRAARQEAQQRQQVDQLYGRLQPLRQSVQRLRAGRGVGGRGDRRRRQRGATRRAAARGAGRGRGACGGWGMQEGR